MAHFKQVSIPAESRASGSNWPPHMHSAVTQLLTAAKRWKPSHSPISSELSVGIFAIHEPILSWGHYRATWMGRVTAHLLSSCIIEFGLSSCKFPWPHRDNSLVTKCHIPHVTFLSWDTPLINSKYFPLWVLHKPPQAPKYVQAIEITIFNIMFGICISTYYS